MLSSPASLKISHQMGCNRPLTFGNISAIPILILLISSHICVFASGRKLARTSDDSKMVEEEKAMWRAQIGSRPPRCERRCGTCTRCEAIQVPTNPKINGNSTAAVADARDEGSSNYKPMSWKCKCGSLVFNP